MTDERDIFSTMIEASKGIAGDAVEDPCGKKAAIEQSEDAVNKFNQAVINGDATGASDNIDKGNWYSIGLHNIKTTMQNNTEKAKIWRGKILNLDHDALNDVIDHTTLPSEENSGFSSEKSRVTDIQKFMNTDHFHQYNGTKNVSKQMQHIFEDKEFAERFKNNLNYGDYISREKMLQMPDEQQQSAKLYNIALKSRDIEALSNKIADSKLPATEIDKYVSQKPYYEQNAMAKYEQIYKDILSVTRQKSSNISDELKRDIFRAIHGERTDNSTASQVSKIWDKMKDTRTTDLSNNGILADTLDNYFPTNHVSTKIASVPMDEYLEDAHKWFDLKKMGHESEEETNREVGDIYNGFTDRSQGVSIDSLRKSQLPPDTEKLFGRDGYKSTFSRKKVIFFKDGESAYEYHKKYGTTDNPIEIMNRYTHDAANEIANVQLFGQTSGMDMLKTSIKNKLGLNYELKKTATLFGRKSTDKDILDTLVRKNILDEADIKKYPASMNPTDILRAEQKKNNLPNWFMHLAKDSSYKLDKNLDQTVLTKKQIQRLDDMNMYLKGGLTQDGETPNVLMAHVNAVQQLGISTMYLGSGLWGLMGDKAAMATAYSSVGNNALKSIIETAKFHNFSQEEMNNIGIQFEYSRNILHKDFEQLAVTARANNASDAIINASGINILTRQNKATLRAAMSNDLTKYLDKSTDEMHPDLAQYFDKKKWDTFRNTDGAVSTLHGMPVINPQQVMYDPGFSLKEREAATHVNGVLNHLIAQGVPESDLISRFDYQRTMQHIKNPLLKMAYKGIMTASSIPMAYMRRIYPMVSQMIENGKYGTFAGLLGYTIMMNSAQKTVRLLLAGKHPTKKTFQDPKFYLDSLVDSGMAMGWTGSTMYNMMTQDSFGSAGSGLVGAGGMKTLWDVSQLMGAGMAGNKKAIRKHAKQVFGNDITMKRMPVIGLITQRMIYDNLAKMMNPDAEQARKREIAKAKKDGTPYWWEP